MSQINKNKTSSHSISSLETNHTLVVNLNTLIIVIIMVLLIGMSFYGGVLYGRGSGGTNGLTIKAAKPLHQFAIGLVIYTSGNEITLNNEDTKVNQTFLTNDNTIVSVDGKPATIKDIKAGSIALIRMSSASPHYAGVIIDNSHFSD